MAKYRIEDNDGKELHVAPFFIDALVWASKNAAAWSIHQGDMTHMRDAWGITRSGLRELSTSECSAASGLGYYFEF